MPPGLLIPGTGHQVLSVESPPKRSTGDWLGAMSRTRFRNAGLTDFGFVPAYCSNALYCIDSPRKPEGSGRLVELAAALAGETVGAVGVAGGTVVAAGVAGGTVAVSVWLASAGV